MGKFSHDRSNVLSSFMSAGAAVCTLFLAVIVFSSDLRRESFEVRRLTLHEIRTHRLRLSELDKAFVCMNSLLGFPTETGKKVDRLGKISNKIKITCKKDWCWKLRLCLGETPASIPDDSEFSIGQDEAWRIARPVHDAIDSYETLTRLACTGALETGPILNVMKTELYPSSLPIQYIQNFYETENVQKRYPGITGVLGALYPEEFPNWANQCSPRNNRGRNLVCRRPDRRSSHVRSRGRRPSC